jgi:hypothetical protein
LFNGLGNSIYNGGDAPSINPNVPAGVTAPSGTGGGGGSIGADAANDLALLSTFRPGSGGGGAAGDEGRGGGGGGGYLRISSATSIYVIGQIFVNGGRGGDSGGDPTCCQGGSGGGGSGGAIWLAAPIVYNAGLISAAGGRGGISQSSRGPPGGQGAPGGLGRIRIGSPSPINAGLMVPQMPALPKPTLQSTDVVAIPGKAYVTGSVVAQ